MNNMKYKLLALDIDGTVVKEHSNVPTGNVIQALRDINKVVDICFTSARAWKDQKIIIDLIGLKPFYHVAENGSKIINPNFISEYNFSISATEAIHLLQDITPYYVEVGFCIDGIWKKEFTKQEIISTISIISESKEKALKLLSILQDKKNKFSITEGAHWSNPDWRVILISHKKASKGNGLSIIQKKLNIHQNETIAVGDGVSDISTMQYAGLKIAMGNAEPELKKIVDIVVPSVIEDGLVTVINTYLK